MQMLKLKAPRVRVEFGTGDLICIVAQIQLALRHPRNRSESAYSAWQVKEFLIGLLNQIQPGIGDHLHDGDGSFFDAMKAQAIKKGNGKGRIIRP